MSDEKEEKEEMAEKLEKAAKLEAEEHPTLSKENSRQVAKDHLEEDDDYYDHETGYGGGGGSPVKFLKREGRADDKRVIDGKGMKTNFD